jgi:tripartite-type tricarboxylate transporter receptor subunit TctC
VNRLQQMTMLVAAAGLVHTGAALSQAFPSKPIRLIVPSPPSGGADVTARIIAPAMSELLRQQVVVENRGGASGMIGGEAVARAAPDGHTLLLAIAPLSINPAMFKKIPYDATRDFAHVSQVVALPNLLIAHPSLPVKNLKDLIALAKARPGQLNFASAGLGSAPHLFFELFLDLAGLKMSHVPYKGAGPGVIDVMAGHVPLMSPTIFAALPHVRSGRLRGLGVTTARRASGAPDIPTIAEAGVAGYEASNWFGVSAPAATPREITQLLSSTIARVLQQPDIRARIATDGAEPVGTTPDEFSAFVRSETVKWGKVARRAGIEPE